MTLSHCVFFNMNTCTYRTAVLKLHQYKYTLYTWDEYLRTQNCFQVLKQYYIYLMYQVSVIDIVLSKTTDYKLCRLRVHLTKLM